MAWSGWEDLGGVIVSGARVASWGPDRLDVFVRGTDNALWHKWWDGTLERLGEPRRRLTAPAAVSWGPEPDRRLRAAAPTTRCGTSGGPARLVGWESLGGVLTSGPGASPRGPRPARRVRPRHRQRAVAQVVDGNGWCGWESLGGSSPADPARVSWGPNRIDVFAPRHRQRLWHKWWTARLERLGRPRRRAHLRSRRGLVGGSRLDVFVARHRQRAVAQVVTATAGAAGRASAACSPDARRGLLGPRPHRRVRPRHRQRLWHKWWA